MEHKYVIEKSKSLKGKVKISGSKNSVLPILAATLLTEETSIISDVPNLSDVEILCSILEHMGGKTEFDKKSNKVLVTCKNPKKIDAPYDYVSKMRASFLIMGPLLARCGYVKLPLPGGCAIGARPVDLHLKGFLALGAEVIVEHGYVMAKAEKLVGQNIYLDFPSVGATENIMMAASLASGVTILENCAIEPEIVDLANFLNQMGANIKGAGTDTIKITGVEFLKGANHTIIPDRIEAGTFMMLSAVTQGDIIIENVLIDHVKPIVAKLKETGVEVEDLGNCLRIYTTGKPIINADIKTMPYPGFPTDMQAQFMALLSIANGTSIVTETIFENRFMHVGELKRMGANIKIESRSAIIEGVLALMGTKLRATDLRAGAALAISAFIADGTTEITDIYHIDRGYENFEEKLLNLGGKISRKDI